MAPVTGKRRFATLTKCERGDRLRIKGLHVTALKISDSWLKKQAAPASGATTIWDSDITGFGVRIFAPTRRHSAGARSFFVNYRIGGRERRFTIGSYPDWSAGAARAQAKELRRRIDRGEDPALDREIRCDAPTVRDLAERYRAEHLANKAKSSQINDWATIKTTSCLQSEIERSRTSTTATSGPSQCDHTTRRRGSSK